MEEDPLIAIGNLEHVPHLLAAQSFYVAQRYDVPLTVRQLVQRGPDAIGQFVGLQAVVNVIAPMFDRGDPASTTVESRCLDSRLGGSHGDSPVFAFAG